MYFWLRPLLIVGLAAWTTAVAWYAQKFMWAYLHHAQLFRSFSPPSSFHYETTFIAVAITVSLVLATRLLFEKDGPRETKIKRYFWMAFAFVFVIEAVVFMAKLSEISMAKPHHMNPFLHVAGEILGAVVVGLFGMALGLPALLAGTMVHALPLFPLLLVLRRLDPPLADQAR